MLGSRFGIHRATRRALVSGISRSGIRPRPAAPAAAGAAAPAPAAGAAAAAAAGSGAIAAAADPAAGFCGLPHVHSPHKLKAYWYSRTKPRLDTLYRACVSCGPELQLLELLDELICELKNMQAKARHCAARHSSREWRDVGQELMSACDKYEAYLHRSTAIYSKVQQVKAALQREVEQQQQQQQQQDVSPPACTSTALPPRQSPQQLGSWLRLADLLLLPFTRQVVQVEDGLSHLLLTGGGAAVASGTAAWNLAAKLATKERQAVAALRAALGSSAGSPPPTLHLDQVEWQCDEPSSSVGATAPGGSGTPACRWESEPLLQPLLARAAVLGLPAGVLALERGALQQLMQHHPDEGLRRAVYERGLLPTKQLFLQLRSRLASLRSALADARGSPSAAHSGMSDLLLGHPLAAAALLEQCAEAARPAAEEQLKHMQAALLRRRQQQQQQQQQQDVTDGEPSPTTLFSALAPWNLAYAQQLLLTETCPLVTSGQMLAQWMSLTHVLKGLGRLLEHSWGIRLELAPPTSSSSSSSSSSSDSSLSEASGIARGMVHWADEEEHEESVTGQTWAPEVLRLRVHVQDTGAQGDLYVDPGGAYGARQLTFYRQQHGPGQSALPAVSLGLKWRWPGGRAEAFPALWELLHELGHALHLLLSSCGVPWKQFGGLQLPLDLLELPSTLMEQLAMHPSTLGIILGAEAAPDWAASPGHDSCSGVDSAAVCEREHLPAGPSMEAVRQLAEHYKACHYNAVDFQEQVLVAAADHLDNMFGEEEDSSSVWERVWAEWSPLVEPAASLPVKAAAARRPAPACVTTLKQLSVAPVVVQHQGTYSVYILAFVLASAAWELHLASDPLDPVSGRRLRQLLFEMSAGDEPVQLLHKLLHPAGGPPKLSAQDCQGTAPLDRDCHGSDAKQANHGHDGQVTVFRDEVEGGLSVHLDPAQLRRWLWSGKRTIDGNLQ